MPRENDAALPVWSSSSVGGGIWSTRHPSCLHRGEGREVRQWERRRRRRRRRRLLAPDLVLIKQESLANAMSSLHAVGGLLHQVSTPSSSLVVSLSRACCITTTSTSLGTAYSVATVAQVGGSRRVTHKSCLPPSSLKSSLSSVKSSPLVGFISVPSPAILGGQRGGAVMPKGSWLSKLGFGNGRAAQTDPYNSPAYGPDDDKPRPGLQFATFGAGCFWGPELAFQRISGVSKTEVGYTQGLLHNPTYGDVCDGDTGHVEVVRVQYDPTKCTYESLLDAFWARHDPTTLNRQGGDVGTQYRSGIYFYTPEQEKAAKESLEAHQAKINKKIVTEILPAKKFYRAEEYHQQYLSKGGRFGFRQSAEKGCKDPIRCYG